MTQLEEANPLREPPDPPVARHPTSYAESIIATLRHPFLVLDRDLRVVRANRSFYETFDVSEEETESRLVYDLGNRQWDIAKFRTLLEDVLAQNHPIHDFEVEHIFPTIGRRIMLLNAYRVARLTHHDQPAELILLAIEDVTEPRELEDALRWSEQRYRRLFESAKDGILILDTDTGAILDANPFLTRLLGYSHAELLGKELWQIGMFQDIAANRAAVRELQQQGYIRYEDLPLRTRGGRQIDVEFVSNVYGEAHQQVIQCNIRDITERKHMQDTMRRQMEDLADANRHKDQFLAMLSHELRGPLAAILNALHILRLQQHENPTQQIARGMLERQVNQLSRLVDDLLEISRITTGRITLHQERIEAGAVVERAVESVRPLITRQRHELSVVLPEKAIWLYTDPTRLEQVVVNLLTNATKYTDAGGRIWLTVSQEGDEMALRVRDTGVGIAPELLPRIFDLFMQADRSLDRSQGGLGIGLTLVQRLVEMQRGTVEARSSGLGHGSEFIVRLPVMLSPAELHRPAGTEAAQPVGRSLRVLVADDDLDVADSSAMLLRMSGHEVQVAHTGPTALAAALAYQPEVMLLDLGLPQMDGYEVALRLRQHAGLQRMVLVALTGYGQDTDRQRSQDAGFDHHMVKPVDWRNLQELLACV